MKAPDVSKHLVCVRLPFLSNFSHAEMSTRSRFCCQLCLEGLGNGHFHDGYIWAHCAAALKLQFTIAVKQHWREVLSLSFWHFPYIACHNQWNCTAWLFLLGQHALYESTLAGNPPHWFWVMFVVFRNGVIFSRGCPTLKIQPSTNWGSWLEIAWLGAIWSYRGIPLKARIFSGEPGGSPMVPGGSRWSPAQVQHFDDFDVSELSFSAGEAELWSAPWVWWLVNDGQWWYAMVNKG